VDEASEMDGPAIISGCEAAKVFQAIEAALDAIPAFVGLHIMRDADGPAPAGRDHDLRPYAGDKFTKSIAVVSFVGKYGGPWLAVDQGWCGG
jgi:hypothetical protein